jgi:hypothetical protein
MSWLLLLASALRISSSVKRVSIEETSPWDMHPQSNKNTSVLTQAHACMIKRFIVLFPNQADKVFEKPLAKGRYGRKVRRRLSLLIKDACGDR